MDHFEIKNNRYYYNHDAPISIMEMKQKYGAAYDIEEKRWYFQDPGQFRNFAQFAHPNYTLPEQTSPLRSPVRVPGLLSPTSSPVRYVSSKQSHNTMYTSEEVVTATVDLNKNLFGDTCQSHSLQKWLYALHIEASISDPPNRLLTFSDLQSVLYNARVSMRSVHAEHIKLVHLFLFRGVITFDQWARYLGLVLHRPVRSTQVVTLSQFREHLKFQEMQFHIYSLETLKDNPLLEYVFDEPQTRQQWNNMFHVTETTISTNSTATSARQNQICSYVEYRSKVLSNESSFKCHQLYLRDDNSSLLPSKLQSYLSAETNDRYTLHEWAKICMLAVQGLGFSLGSQQAISFKEFKGVVHESKVTILYPHLAKRHALLPFLFDEDHTYIGWQGRLGLEKSTLVKKTPTPYYLLTFEEFFAQCIITAQKSIVFPDAVYQQFLDLAIFPQNANDFRYLPSKWEEMTKWRVQIAKSSLHTETPSTSQKEMTLQEYKNSLLQKGVTFTNLGKGNELNDAFYQIYGQSLTPREWGIRCGVVFHSLGEFEEHRPITLSQLKHGIRKCTISFQGNVQSPVLAYLFQESDTVNGWNYRYQIKANKSNTASPNKITFDEYKGWLQEQETFNVENFQPHPEWELLLGLEPSVKRKVRFSEPKPHSTSITTKESQKVVKEEPSTRFSLFD